MEITKNKIALLDYTLKDNTGKIIDSTHKSGPLAYIHGVGQIIPGLEKALEGKCVDDDVVVEVDPEEGYGSHDATLIKDIPKDAFSEPKHIKPDELYRVMIEGKKTLVKVLKVKWKSVKVDANHPLAGKKLYFDVSILEVREATVEELSHGHVHGPGGYRH